MAGPSRDRIAAETAKIAPADRLELLRAVTILADLPMRILSRLAEEGDVIEAAAGTTLVKQGTVPNHLFILLDGQVGLTATAASGETAIVEILRPVDQFQLAAMLTGTPSAVSAQALETVRLFRIPATFLRKLSEAEPSLAFAMLASLARHYRMLLQQVKDLKLHSAAQRLGCFILKLGAEQGSSHRIRLPFGKQLLAARLGTTPENLSRAFATLRKHGVTTSGSHVVINDVLSLAAFALPDEIA
jgi:CRP/FNR family transcriptional regulator, transcriptional activator FtrB